MAIRDRLAVAGSARTSIRSEKIMSRSLPRGRAASASLALVLASFVATAASALVVDFGDVALAGPDTFANGGPATNTTGFVSGGVHFSNDYNADYGSWYGFAVSNTTDTTTPGYFNQYSAITGGGFGDAQYGVAYGSAYGSPTFITFGSATAPESVRLTNTTYTALDLRDGSGFTKKFGGVSGNDADYLTITLTGRDAVDTITGSVVFYLADYRFADSESDYVVEEWSLVDLTPLGASVKTITLTFDSSDVGIFGINTPTYVALDSLTVSVIPEPSAVAALAGCAGLLIAGSRRRRGGVR
jgi:hypothetical protein